VGLPAGRDAAEGVVRERLSRPVADLRFLQAARHVWIGLEREPPENIVAGVLDLERGSALHLLCDARGAAVAVDFQPPRRGGYVVDGPREDQVPGVWIGHEGLAAVGVPDGDW